MAPAGVIGHTRCRHQSASSPSEPLLLALCGHCGPSGLRGRRRVSVLGPITPASWPTSCSRAVLRSRLERRDRRSRPVGPAVPFGAFGSTPAGARPAPSTRPPAPVDPFLLDCSTARTCDPGHGAAVARPSTCRGRGRLRPERSDWRRCRRPGNDPCPGGDLSHAEPRRSGQGRSRPRTPRVLGTTAIAHGRDRRRDSAVVDLLMRSIFGRRFC